MGIIKVAADYTWEHYVGYRMGPGGAGRYSRREGINLGPQK